MRRYALILLSFGLLVMALGLLLAFTATPTMHTEAASLSVFDPANTCINCHEDAHADWAPTLSLQVVGTESAAGSAIKVVPEVTGETVQLCSSCHFMDAGLALPEEQFAARIDATQARVRTLRADLALVHAVYTDWETNAYHSDKSSEQIKAERIDTLITFVEADGSWGFHHPRYTDDVLSEAETLMTELLAKLDD